MKVALLVIGNIFVIQNFVPKSRASRGYLWLSLASLQIVLFGASIE